MSEQKKTLNIKPGTLGLSKSHSGNVHTQPTTTPSTKKGKVVVVTKTRVGMQRDRALAPRDERLTDNELQQRLQVLKQAEIAKKAAEEAAIATATATATIETLEVVVDIPQETDVESVSEHIDQVSMNIETPILSSATVIEEVVIEEEVPHPVAVLQEKPVAETKKVSLDEILAQNKMRNLDSLYRKKQEEPVKDLDKEIAPTKAKETVITAKTPVKKSYDEEREINYAKKTEAGKSKGKLSVAQVLMLDGEEGAASAGKRRSLASIMRARDKAKRKAHSMDNKPQEKVVREVNVPDFISVQDLANRMAEKVADVVKALMRFGMMVTATQLVDADTAELIVGEFGHKIKRVTEAELESALLQLTEDTEADLQSRPPVVTIMGHVDHGKTSLLDALRKTDVAASEAGGITQHIGAYQIHLPTGKLITFLDTPGHEAFTAMRMRGAKATDIVVLVVAADDGIMQQTVEAINHAKAAQVPIIVAINKIDKPEADPMRVKNELFQHSLVPDDMGGDVMVVEVSAKQQLNLDKLEEIILLQAEMLDLKANPTRNAQGVVVEAKVSKGKGVVATLLVQKGTLSAGDIIVAGSSYGKIKLLINDKGQHINKASPAMPVEVIGLDEAPVAGDEFLVVANEKTARDIVAMRLEREKQRRIAARKSTTLEQMFKNASGIKELSVIIKGDVQGSVEAIMQSLQKLSGDEIVVRILHAAVGGINESDITLATASNAVVLGFNVRANQQARDLARLHNIDIKYYSIIYNLVDDIKAAMTGMLSPILRENHLGYVEIREVFDLTKYGKIAGCYVTDGMVKRHCHVRIIRDSVVIYSGKLKALKRFKDDVKEVNHGFECGMSFENYEDFKAGDKVEVYEVTEQAAELSIKN